MLVKGEQKYCLVNENVLIPVKADAEDWVKIAVNPKSVKIVASKKADDHAEILKGRIFQLTEEREKVRVVADVGIPLSVLLKKKNILILGFVLGTLL